VQARAVSVSLGVRQIEAILTNCLNLEVPNGYFANNALEQIRVQLGRDWKFDDYKSFKNPEFQKKVTVHLRPWHKHVARALSRAANAIERRVQEETVLAKFHTTQLALI